VFESTESKDKVENLLLTVTTTDDGGRSAGDPGYEGASRNGECRVYFNNMTPVDSQELYDRAFERLDNIVQREGGIEAILQNPEMIPQVHIRGDVNAPWRCVAGTIFNVQAAGYPTVGFISNPVDPNG
jgi:biopolymer transport protein ExbD